MSLRPATAHRSAQSDDAFLDAEIDVRRIDVIIVGQSRANLFSDAIVGPPVIFRKPQRPLARVVAAESLAVRIAGVIAAESFRHSTSSFARLVRAPHARCGETDPRVECL